MTSLLKRHLQQMADTGAANQLSTLNKGVEKESLRILPDGLLSPTPHPAALGSTLTHPSITTDYSEALLEFVTPVHKNAKAIIDDLCNLHTYVYQNIGNEKLWVNSMPCILQGDDNIPLAQYGSSNIGRMKTVYRMGLGHRYGRLMQTIAGIHYNFSLPNTFWEHWVEGVGSGTNIQDTKSKLYFAGVRNVHRHCWLIFYLFGASPAVCKTFLEGRHHELVDFDAGSFYLPHATTLRMSSLGYSSDAQASIQVSFDDIESYTETLKAATKTSHPAYEKIGIKSNGEYLQLNTNLLQIENEYYAVVRPKRAIESGETPTHALENRGVQYLELRAIDLNPFSPVGMDETQLDFLDLFLTWCIFSDSPNMSEQEQSTIQENKRLAATAGRDPELRLNHNGQPKGLREWGLQLCDEMTCIAELLDKAQNGLNYSSALEAQRTKLKGEQITPAEQIIQEMSNNSETFYEFASRKAMDHEQYFKTRTLSEDAEKTLQKQAADSLKKQEEIEQSDLIPFEEFLQNYFSQ